MPTCKKKGRSSTRDLSESQISVLLYGHKKINTGVLVTAALTKPFSLGFELTESNVQNLIF
jgi:hypothetical protein